MRPNNPFSFVPNTTIIGTLYRGNLYEDEKNDQLGGDDLNDIVDLYKALPIIKKENNLNFPLPKTMIGASRGAMQMVASVAHSEFLRERVSLLISLSGNLNFQITHDERPEMRYLFSLKFKEQTKLKTLEDWIAYRNPTELVHKLPNALKVVLFYGLNDNRVPISEQTTFIEALKAKKISFKFIKLKNADHSLDGKQNLIKKKIYQEISYKP